MIANPIRHLLVLISILASCSVKADLNQSMSVMLLAGEIVLGTDADIQLPNNQKKKKGSSDQSSSQIPMNLEEEGFLIPRGGAPAEQREYESRMREQAKRQVTSEMPPATAIILQIPNGTNVGPSQMPFGKPPYGPTNQERAGELRDKARGYTNKNE